MIREVILQPTSLVSEDAGNSYMSRDPGSSPYPDGNSPTNTLAECWSDDDNATYWYTWPIMGTGTYARVLAGFQPAPTLVIIKSVTLKAWWSYSQQGPNNWFFPPDNSFGPRARLTVRNRAKTDYLYGSYRTIVSPGDDAYNDNINTHIGYSGPLLQEWTTTAHPEGGPWILDDLNVANFAAGIHFEFSPPAFTNVQGSFFKVRVHKFNVVLSVEDLGGYVKNIRNNLAILARLRRRPENLVMLDAGLHNAPAGVGSLVYMIHPDGPSIIDGGWGERRLERRPGQVVRKRIRPETCSSRSEVFDRQTFACLLWAAYRIDCPWSPEGQGLMYLDKGGDFTHSRDQDGWSPRPGDGALMRVLPDYPNLSFHGLAAAGGGDTAVALRNYDLMQTGWSTVSSSGGFSAAADTSVVFAEEQGYQSSCKMTFAAAGTGGREQSLGALGAGRLHVRVIVKNTSITNPEVQFAEWYLRKGTDYWNNSTRAWVASPVYNPLPSTDPFGEDVADSIPATATTYHVGVGRFSSSMSDATIHAGIVDVQHTDTTVAGARPPIVTLGSTIVREPDIHRIDNMTTAEVWDYARVCAVAEVRPFWRAEDLPADAVKPLLHAFHATGSWDALQFVPKTGTSDLIRFERAVSGQTTFQLDCALPALLDLNRSHILRVWVRVLGADGWTQYAPYSVEVGYGVFLASDGSYVTSGSAVGTLSYTGNVATRDWVGVGNDSSSRYADAYVRMIEVRRNPLSGVEAVWRV